MKRASGAARHAVRVAVVELVNELGPQPFPSIRAAARAIAELVDYAESTVRRALSDWTLEAELELLVDPVSHEGARQGATREPGREPGANPQVVEPEPAPYPEATPYVSTRPLSDGGDAGPMQHPRPSHGRRPKEFRRSSFPGRCTVCSLELEHGEAYYLTPYDTGTVTACLEHAPLALAGSQMLYDVTRGREVPTELELIVRPRRPRG